MDYYQKSLELHEKNKGKIEIISKVSLTSREDLSTAYTPGVAEPCLRIRDDQDAVYRYTAKGNLVAVVTDGSAVLGLGNIGARAALPVMEGKCILFKEFAGVDAFPICIETQDTEEIISVVKNIAAGFGGINLEDISAPKCFEVERRLQEIIDIPVFHDDQHGTAIVTAAALINAMKIVNKDLTQVSVVINGAGAAGTAIVKMLLSLHVKDIVACDRKGILSVAREGGLEKNKQELAMLTNPILKKGDLRDAIKGADVFIGVSSPRVLTKDMICKMKKDAVIFAMANPEPEIMPDQAKEAGARIVGTGRSDFPNQINNTLVFPGLFKGALAARAERITESMKIAAVYALADIVTEKELREDYIIPNPFNKKVVDKIAEAVAKVWQGKGINGNEN